MGEVLYLQSHLALAQKSCREINKNNKQDDLGITNYAGRDNTTVSHQLMRSVMYLVSHSSLTSIPESVIAEKCSASVISLVFVMPRLDSEASQRVSFDVNKGLLPRSYYPKTADFNVNFRFDSLEKTTENSEQL